MKQTSVDWLFQQLWETPKDKLTWHSILEQAKQMEKEQIMDAYHRGYANAISVPNKEYNPEQYYNENYKSK